MTDTIRCETHTGEFVDVPVDKIQTRLSVYVVVFKDSSLSEVLVLPQHGNGFQFPGGGGELWETHTQTGEREVKEETGLTTRVRPMPRPLAMAQNFYVHPTSGIAYNWTEIYLMATQWSGQITTDHMEDGEQEYCDKAIWLPVAKIPTLIFHGAADPMQIIMAAKQELGHL